MHRPILFAAAFVTLTLFAVAAPAPVRAGTIYATGQLFVPADPTHNDIRENRFYAIDTLTGAATPLSPALPGEPPGLGMTAGGELFGYDFSGQLTRLDPFTGAQTLVGTPKTGATGFDILADGRAFKVSPGTASVATRVFQVDLTTGAETPVGSPTAIADAFAAAFGPAASSPQVIGLGSLGNTLYGVNLQSGRTNLFSFNVDTGAVQVIGAQNAVGGAFGGRYSGFAALTGVDENADGQFDALLGNINFDSLSPNPQRIGALARYDLSTGTFNVVGQNSGLIFFGFASAPAQVIPEPGTLVFALAGLPIAGLVLRRRRCHACGRPAKRARR